MQKEHKLYNQLKAGYLNPATTQWMAQHPEEWRPVIGLEGWYEVSNWGHVRRSRAGKATFIGRPVKPCLRKNARVTVYLRAEGRDLQKEVHQLVTAAFLGPKPTNHEVNHIDGNPANNCIYNLEYCTRSDNALHAFSLGLFIAKRGEEVPWSKLTNEQVMVIRACKDALPQRTVAKAFSISRPTVRNIQQHNIWKHI